MQKRFSFNIIFLTFLILTFSGLNNNFLLNSSSEITINSEPLINYIKHVAICITHDDNFTDLGFLGIGTANDPFLIHNLNITTTANRGIQIYDTTKHFVISSCYIESRGYGIDIDTVAAGTVSIINCTISGNIWDGIFIQDTSSIKIINSTIINNFAEGIKLDQSPGAIITNNTVQNNADNGISLWYSSNTTLIDNTLVNDGVFVYDVSIENYRNLTMINNSVNGKEIGYFKDTNDLIISNPIYGQLIIIWCQKVNIFNQILSNGAIGMFLFYCDYAYIANNTCNNNVDDGISLLYSDYAMIENNTCNNNGDGINLEISSYSTIFNNTCIDNNFRGVRLLAGYYCEILNNTANDSGFIDIYIGLSDDITVTNNTCIGSVYYGIYSQHSSTCIITYNQINECNSYGIFLDSNSVNNIIHHNNFTDNNLSGMSQGYDDGTGNVFYDIITLSGNWWNNWDGSTTYLIAGTANNYDPYPLGIPMIHEFLGSVCTLFILSAICLTSIYIITVSKRKLRK